MQWMLRLGIIGAGVMGANHARVALSLRDAELVAVVEPNEAPGKTLAEASGCSHFFRVEDVIGKIDAAVLATPTPSHASVAEVLLDQGVSVLVEKPFVSKAEDGWPLVEKAKANDLVLMIGHTERFNPAVLELEGIVQGVIDLQALRLSPYSERVKDGVILDLMIHDLDIAMNLVKSPIKDVYATARTIRSNEEDLAHCLMVFENGVTASFSVSRVAQNKIRTLQITQEDGFINVDLLRQDITVSRVHHSEYLSSQGSRYRQSGLLEIPFIESRGEPLFLQLNHFVECVQAGGIPRVSGEDGLRALELVERVRQAAQSSKD
jgi:predicted dehydrogenase